MNRTYLCTGCGRQAFKDPCKSIVQANSGEKPSASLGKWRCDRCGNKIKVKVVTK